MDYLKYYGLVVEPFSNAPVSRFYYNSKQHSEAMIKLTYAVKHMRGLAVVEGAIGTGKTTLARRMLEQLPENEYEAAMLVIVHSEITANWLLKRIALQLGVDKPAGNKLNMLSQLYKRLVEIYKQGKKAVVLIDEAQMLRTREIMEEFRGMLNLEVPERKLITFIMFGLPEISDHLKIDEPLRQRVAMRYRLQPLDLEATGHYIIHRLRMAGARKMFFTVEAIKAIHYYTRGNPRQINTCCDNALLEGFLRKQPIIDRRLIEHVAKELGLPHVPGDSTQSEVRTRDTTDMGFGASGGPAIQKDTQPQLSGTYYSVQPGTVDNVAGDTPKPEAPPAAAAEPVSAATPPPPPAPKSPSDVAQTVRRSTAVGMLNSEEKRRILEELDRSLGLTRNVSTTKPFIPKQPSTPLQKEDVEDESTVDAVANPRSTQPMLAARQKAEQENPAPQPEQDASADPDEDTTETAEG